MLFIAYHELAGKELLKANQIGDTEGHASVKMQMILILHIMLEMVVLKLILHRLK